MSPSPNRSSLDRIILPLVIGLVVILGGLAVLVEARGMAPAKISSPAGAGLIGGRGPLVFDFGMAVDHSSLESAVAFTPDWPGKWTWPNDQQAWFYPSQAFPAGTTIRVNVQAGVKARNGLAVKKAETLDFKVRDLNLVYLSNPTYGGDLWVTGPDGAHPQRLTNTNEGVYDFSVSPDGQKIIYAQINTQGGTDLVVINRDGSGERTLLSCAEKTCMDLAWAPDNNSVAYSQYTGGVNSNLGVSDAQIYVVDTSSGNNNLLFLNQGVYGFEPAFSPDGQSVAYYDVDQKGIRIVNLTDGSSSVVPTAVEEVGSWSPDSQKMVYADVAPEALVPYDQLYLVDLASKKVSRLDDSSVSNVDYSLPEWSPDGKWLVVGVQSTNAQATQQLWLMGTDGKLVKAITQDMLSVHAAYQWAPAGGKIAYQQVEMGSDNPTPQVFVWDMASGQTVKVADDAALPAWLP